MTDPLGLINAPGLTPGVQALRPGGATNIGGDNAVAGSSFKDLLMKNLEQVNQLQQDAQHAVEDLAAGRRHDLDSVLAAQQKADLAFQLLVQVRNKMMDAYDEIKNVRV